MVTSGWQGQWLWPSCHSLPCKWGFQRGALGSSSQQSSQHHFLFPFASLALWLEAEGYPFPAGATTRGFTPPYPKALDLCSAPVASAVATLALGALLAWLYRLGLSLWSGSRGTGRTIPVSGSGSRPNTSGLILSPQEGDPALQGGRAVAGMLSSPVGLCSSCGPALLEFSKQGAASLNCHQRPPFPW